MPGRDVISRRFGRSPYSFSKGPAYQTRPEQPYAKPLQACDSRGSNRRPKRDAASPRMPTSPSAACACSQSRLMVLAHGRRHRPAPASRSGEIGRGAKVAGIGAMGLSALMALAKAGPDRQPSIPRPPPPPPPPLPTDLAPCVSVAGKNHEPPEFR